MADGLFRPHRFCRNASIALSRMALTAGGRLPNSRAERSCLPCVCELELLWIRLLRSPQSCGREAFVGQECKMLHLCGFLKKHRGNDLASQWFHQEYCTGPKQEACKRREYMIGHGKMPPDGMAPDGEIVQPLAAS